MRVTCQTAGGRTNTLQASTSASGGFADLSGPVGMPGLGIITTDFLHVGGAPNIARSHRLRALVP